MKPNDGWVVIAKQLESSISDILNKVGIHFRIFYRIKNEGSILEKIERKKEEGKLYSFDGKKMQDMVGIRIVTYFNDDISLLRQILDNKFKLVEDSTEELKPTEFKPKKTNLIYKLPGQQSEICEAIIQTVPKEYLKLVDTTFEVQLRTILSEGWHEVEHSLRYKCAGDWANFPEQSRMLNGIYASLETSDTTLQVLFNQLAYSHFKANNWEAMLRTKFRLRFGIHPLKSELAEILDKESRIGKAIVKIEREDFLLYLSKIDISLPLTFSNVLLLLNKYKIQNLEIEKLYPSLLHEL